MKKLQASAITALGMAAGLAAAGEAYTDRLVDLIGRHDSVRPNHTREPELGEWTFRYHQSAERSNDPCVIEYRYTLTSRFIGNDRLRGTDCTHAPGDERCGTVSLPLGRVQGLEARRPGGTGSGDEPAGYYFEISFHPSEGEDPVHLRHAFLTTSEADHYLMDEALRGLIAACSTRED